MAQDSLSAGSQKSHLFKQLKSLLFYNEEKKKKRKKRVVVTIILHSAILDGAPEAGGDPGSPDSSYNRRCRALSSSLHSE